MFALCHHKTLQCLESMLWNARTHKRLFIPNNSRCWNCLSHQWCTPFDMNRQMAVPVAHTLYCNFLSNPIVRWPGVKASVMTRLPHTKTNHLHVPLHRWLMLQLLLLYCLVCLAENNYAGISWCYRQAHSERVSAGNGWRHASCWLLLLHGHVDDKVSVPPWHHLLLFHHGFV